MSERAAHRADLQGLRGVAVLLVVLYHAGRIVPGGFIGVDVFFVLSGFVIGASILREADRTGSMSLGNFYARRVRRILPAAAVLSVVTLLVFAVVMSPFGNQQVMAKTSASASVWLSNMALATADGAGYFDTGSEENPFLHTWSLGVEEQFYLFLPVAMVLIFATLARRPGATERRIQIVLGTVAAASLVLSVALVDLEISVPVVDIDPTTLAFYLPFSRFWELLAGVLLATSVLAAREVDARWHLLAGAVGLALLAVSSFGYDEFTAFPGLASIPPVVATLLIIWAGTSAGGLFARAVSVAPLRFLGDNSYAWYLWHWPAVVLAALLWSDSRTTLLIAATLALIPAFLSTSFLEQPLRRNQSIVGRKALGLAVVCVGVPLALAIVVLAGAGQRWGLDEPIGWDDIPVARDAGCHVTDVASDFSFDETDCIFEAPTDAGDEGLVMVLGDSHASSLASAVIGAAHPRGFDVGVWSGSGCPYILDVGPNRQFDDCRKWVDAASELVADLQPAVVVIANRSTIYTHPTVGEPENAVHRLSTSSSDASDSRNEALALWSAGIEATVADLEAGGARVVVLGMVPEFWPDFVDRYSLARPDLDPVMTRAELDERQTDVDAATQAGLPDTAAFVDPTDTICPAFPCRPTDDAGWLYYDPDHLNERGSRLLADDVGAALDTVLS